MKVIMNHYPLGHHSSELSRLEAQALLLHDDFLDELAAKSVSCLEIGCGNGANFSLIKRANPCIEYTGIDISPLAIQAAKFKITDQDATFMVMDGQSIHLDKKFDLIFTKLVLWATGDALEKILQEVKRLLTTHGTFYALEPCNQLIQFYPPKPYLSSWMKQWDNAVIQSGLNPHIGIHVANKLIEEGFNKVDSKFMPFSSLGRNQSRYTSIMNNLKGFYMGSAVNYLELNFDEALKNNAINELNAWTSDSFVMDALFAAWGSL